VAIATPYFSARPYLIRINKNKRSKMSDLKVLQKGKLGSRTNLPSINQLRSSSTGSRLGSKISAGSSRRVSKANVSVSKISQISQEPQKSAAKKRKVYF
jgi:hypothetical protein